MNQALPYMYTYIIADLYLLQLSCVKRQLTPSYATIKVPNISPAYEHTKKKYLSTIRIK